MCATVAILGDLTKQGSPYSPGILKGFSPKIHLSPRIGDKCLIAGISLLGPPLISKMGALSSPFFLTERCSWLTSLVQYTLNGAATRYV